MSMTFRFNTGRRYTPQGQRITAFAHDDGTVDFSDHDRQIDGRLLDKLPQIIPADDGPIQIWIVSRYDAGQYTDLPRDARTAVHLDPATPFSLIHLRSAP